MRMRTQSKTIAVGAAALVCSMTALGDEEGPAINAQIEGDGGAALATAFKADVARMESEMNMAAAAATSSATAASGIHGRVVGLSTMKTLVVRKNSDGTISIAHASSAEDIAEFVEADTAASEEEE
ncbi:MAG: hypothetical protein AAF417_16245 [Pseudomonadota bacterium]